jgi:hypothetical protein
MGKKEKVVELKPKAEKISDEHLKEIQETIGVINNFQFNLGKLEAQKHDILHRLATAQDKVTLLQDTLQKEYGTNDINIQDGTINWPDENKKEDEK